MCRQTVSYTEAIQLAEKHASQNGLTTELDFEQILGDGGLDINLENLTSLTLDDAFEIAGKIPVLGDFVKEFGAIITKGVEMVFGSQDSGVPGTDFYIDVAHRNQYANINSGAWALLAKKYQNQGAYICTSKQKGYLTSLKRGYIGLNLTPEQIDESRLFILMNLRAGADQPQSTMDDSVNFINDLGNYEKTGVPNDSVTGSEIITVPMTNETNQTNDILMYLGLGALLFFISKK